MDEVRAGSGPPDPAPRARGAAGGPSGIRDVATAAGVSVATVSRALRGLDRVSEETRRRVLRAAEELHYVASPTAASLATGRTWVVGVVVPFLDRWFFATMVSEVEEVLRRHGYQVLLLNVGDRAGERILVLERRLLVKRIDAVLVLSVDLDPAEEAVLQQVGMPVVTVGMGMPGCARVGIDDVAAAATAAGHLLALGHRRIAYIGGDERTDVRRATAVDRGRGVGQALADAGAGTDPELFTTADWSVAGGWRSGEALLARRDPPTAVVAASDEMAIGVLCAARSLGWAVPQDLSVVGIDDHEMSITHGLTTVAQPVREQGRTAAHLLLAQLAGEAPGGAREVVLGTSLVLRSSTAPPRRLSRPRRGRGAPPRAHGCASASAASAPVRAAVGPHHPRPEHPRPEHPGEDGERARSGGDR